MTRHLHLVGDPAQPPIWLGRTPTGVEFQRMPLAEFHAAIDRLEADTVGERYWRKVIASRQAEAWGIR